MTEMATAQVTLRRRNVGPQSAEEAKLTALVDERSSPDDTPREDQDVAVDAAAAVPPRQPRIKTPEQGPLDGVDGVPVSPRVRRELVIDDDDDVPIWLVFGGLAVSIVFIAVVLSYVSGGVLVMPWSASFATTKSVPAEPPRTFSVTPPAVTPPPAPLPHPDTDFVRVDGDIMLESRWLNAYRTAWYSKWDTVWTYCYETSFDIAMGVEFAEPVDAEWGDLPLSKYVGAYFFDDVRRTDSSYEAHYAANRVFAYEKAQQILGLYAWDFATETVGFA
jgi:hypothetical protein